MDKTQIKKKIRQLLLLAENAGATESEAILALERAKELLDKYEITQDELKEEILHEKVFLRKMRLGTYDKYIFSILTTYYYVIILKNQVGNEREYIFVGEPHAIDIAYDLYLYLRKTFVSLFRTYRKYNKRAQAQSYYMGLHNGIIKILQQKEEDKGHTGIEEELSTSLVVRDVREKLEKTFHCMYGNIKQDKAPEIDAHDLRAMIDGNRDSHHVNLYKRLL